MRVLKFGGAALRDGAAVRHALALVGEFGGPRPVLVVSAHAGVTELLEQAFLAARRGELSWDPLRIRHRTLLRQLELPQDLLDRPLRELRGTLASLCHGRRAADGSGEERELDERRLRDLVLSFGERLSARVVAAALSAAGTDATPMDAHDLGLLSGGEGLGPPEAARGWLGALLERAPGVPVVTGFFALDGQGHLATLGSNGSDLTASWLGAALRADEVQLWKRVPGILSADPRLVPDARPLRHLGWEQAESLARHGSGVLHPETVAPARGAGVVLRVMDFDHPAAPGTRIGGDVTADAALAHRTGIACLRVQEAGEQAGRPSALFAALARAGVEPYLASTRGGTIEVLVADGAGLERVLPRLPSAVQVETGLATVAWIEARAQRSEGRLRAEALVLAHGAREFPWGECGEPGASATRVFLLPADGLAALMPDLHVAWLGARLQESTSNE